MSISFYTGVPGSGKSYHCAQEIYKALRKGKTVISNIDINTSAIPPKRGKQLGNFIYVNNQEWLNNSLMCYRVDSRGRMTSNSYIPTDIYSYIQGLKGYALNFHAKNSKGQIKLHQTLLVFDECQELWNSRTWNRNDRLHWTNFFRIHRKLGYDCILISQDDKCIDKQIRNVLETQYLHRNVSNYKKLGKILSIPFGGNLFVCVKSMYGMSKKDSKISSSFVFGNNKYFEIYNTNQLY